MLEGILFGIAGGTAVVAANKACHLCRTSKEQGTAAFRSDRSVSSMLSSCWEGTVESTRELFAECRAELEATRVAIEEVRHPSSNKVVRIY